MAFGFIKSTQGSAASVQTLTVTVPAVRAGDLVVVNIKFSASVTGLTVTDNASTPNTYALAAGPVAITGELMYQYYGVAITGGATHIIISWTNTTNCRATADEFSGGKKTNATVFDKSANNSAGSGFASVSLIPTNAGELIVAGVSFNAGGSAMVAGTNYLMATNNTSQSTMYRQAGTTSETAPMSWSGSPSWIEITSAFIPQSNIAGNFMEFMGT
jgi:hypothetical protein